MDISLNARNTLSLSQMNFVSRQRFPNIEDIAMSKTFVVALEKVKSFFRTSIGGLLRLPQTRYDLSFRVIGIAVRLNDASKNVEESIAPNKESAESFGPRKIGR